MPDAAERNLEWKCLFCRMTTRRRALGAPLCPICWDQLNDFVWVSFVQVIFLVVGVTSGLFFVVEEVLLLFVLIFVKHRMPPLLGPFTESS